MTMERPVFVPFFLVFNLIMCSCSSHGHDSVAYRHKEANRRTKSYFCEAPADMKKQKVTTLTPETNQAGEAPSVWSEFFEH